MRNLFIFFFEKIFYSEKSYISTILIMILKNNYSNCTFETILKITSIQNDYSSLKHII